MKETFLAFVLSNIIYIIMGAVQSAFEDCATSTPAYLQEYLGTPSGARRGSSHTTIVYSAVPTYDAGRPRSGSGQKGGRGTRPFRSPRPQNINSNTSPVPYSGPSLVGLNPDTAASSRNARNFRDNRSAIDFSLRRVDINDERYRRKLGPGGSDRPGGSVYETPSSVAGPVCTDIWDEAGAAAEILGPVRVDPLNGTKTSVRIKREKKSSKTRAAHAAESEIEAHGKKKSGSENMRNEKYDEIASSSSSIDSDENASDVDSDADGCNGEDALLRQSVKKLADEVGGGKTSEAADGANTISASEKAKLEELEICRQEEANLLKMLNIAAHPMEAASMREAAATRNEYINEWYLIEGDWFRQWTGFLKCLDERPGRIQNSKLVCEANGEAWPGLDAGTHYVAVDAPAWGLLSEVYGFDVVIVRTKFDIYCGTDSDQAVLEDDAEKSIPDAGVPA